MKRENNHKDRIIKMSFQTQLFLIVLVCFILFVVIDYVIIDYSFRNRYIKSKSDSVNEDVISLSRAINSENKPRIEILEEFQEDKGYITVVVNSSTGTFSLTDYEYSSYEITGIYNDTIYKLYIPEFNVVLNVNDVLDIYINK